MAEVMIDHQYQTTTGSNCKRPLLEKPSLLPMKKPALLQHPTIAENVTSRVHKIPLLDSPPEHTSSAAVLKPSWLPTKRPCTSPDELNLNNNGVKRQALLPTPQEWGVGPPNNRCVSVEKAEKGGLLPRPFSGGLLPMPSRSVPTPCTMYGNKVSLSLQSAPLQESKSSLIAPVAVPVPVPKTSLSPSSTGGGLLPLPTLQQSKQVAGVKSNFVEQLNTVQAPFKKPPLLQTPRPVEQQGLIFAAASPNKTHLLPTMLPTKQDKICCKTPLLKNPPGVANVANPHTAKDSAMSLQRSSREPLIPTPPILSVRPETEQGTGVGVGVFKNFSASVNYHQTPQIQNTKRPLLPTPSLLF